MKSQFLANENFPFPSIRLLRENGVQIKSIGELYGGGISDQEFIQIAQKEKLIILTFDRDYGQLIVQYGWGDPPDVIYFRLKGSTPLSAEKKLIELIGQKMKFENAFTVIDRNGIRQRKY